MLKDKEIENFLNDYEIKIKKFSIAIAKFKEDINKIYIDLGNILQKKINKIVENIENSFENIHNLISYNQDGNTKDETENYLLKKDIGLIEILNYYKNELESLITPLKSSKDNSSNSFTKSIRYLSEISNILKSVDTVKEFSDDMEVLSFNSIILATQSGAKGAGFRSISENINQLSRLTTEKFEQLRSKSEEVLSKYDNYNSLVTMSRNLKISEGNNLKQKFDSFYNTNIENLYNNSNSIKNIIKELKSVKEQVYNIILELQNEDIINQVLTNLYYQVEIILNTISNLKRYKVDEIKDLYIFVGQMDNFMIEKIEKVENTLNKLLNMLKGNILNITSTTNKCSDFIKEIKQNFSDNEKTEKDADNRDFYNQIINQINILNKNYKSIINKLINYQDNISQTGDNFIKGLSEVDYIYKDLSDIIDEMKSVSTLVKIELVRENIEKNTGQNTGNVMEKMLIEIENYIQELMKRFKTTKEKLGEIIEEISIIIDNQKLEYLNNQKKISEFFNYFLKKAKIYKTEICIEIENLDNSFNDIKEFLIIISKNIDSITTFIKNQTNELDLLKNNIKYIKNILISNYNINDINVNLIKDSKIKFILTEIKENQNKTSLNKYIENNFDYKGNNDMVIF